MGIPYAEVIGDPIAHSKSPIIHKFWLKGLDADYRATRVSESELETFLAIRRQDPDWLGCNVTRPHKETVLAYVDNGAMLRATIGAANFIRRRRDGHLSALNFDAEAVRELLASATVANATVAVVGAGGAARAAVFALKQLGVGRVIVIARDQAKAERMLVDLGVAGQSTSFSSPLPEATVLINASPLGQTGEPSLELDLAPLRTGAVVFDMVYSPLETELLRAARRRGLRAIDGLTMLIEQAALSFEYFFEVVLDRSRDHQLRDLLTR